MITDITNVLAHYAPLLADVFVKSAVLLILVFITIPLLRWRTASLRHFMYSAAMVCLLVLPFAATLLPKVGLAVLPVQDGFDSPSKPASIQEPAAKPSLPNAPAPIGHTGPRSTNPPALTLDRLQLDFSSHNGAGTASSTAKTIGRLSKANWPGVLVVLWTCGSALCLLRMAVVTLRLRGIVRRAAPVESIVLASSVRWLCRDFGIRREVVLLASHELDVPIAAGIFGPKVILSPQYGEWSETRRHAVLCHEIAHIKRHDALTQLLASIAAALYWINPLVWFVLRAMRNERERACDDYVLASGTPASDYAHELIEIVSALVHPQPVAALAMARRSHLEGRVLALVNSRVAHGALSRGSALLLTSAIVGIALPLAAAHLQERSAILRHDLPAVGFTAPLTPAPIEPPLAVARLAVSAEPTNPVSDPDESVWGIDIPVYPNAVAGEHDDGRGTVSLADGAHVRRLTAGAFFSADQPTKVLTFYRDRLKSRGQVIECMSGTNRTVDLQVNDASFADPSSCRSGEFAQGGTELKVNNSGDQRVVVVVPHHGGSEIALVRYLPTQETELLPPQARVSDSAMPDCLDMNRSAQSSVNSHSDDNGYRTWTATWSGGQCSIEASSSGSVRFNAEATAIESISPGGRFEVNERIGDTLRHLRVDPNQNGQPTFTYKVNGAQQEFDAAARAWFAKFLLHLERVTGYAANTRVPALLAKGGPEAVLDETKELESDYVRQVYFTQLFENATLSPPLLVRALEQARAEISTDYSLAQVLLTIAQRYDLADESQRVAFLNGANKLHTDYEHSRVLLELLKRPNLSPEIVRAALESAKGIGTDYERGRILTTLAGLKSFDEGEVTTYLDLASSIHTDYEHSRCLMTLIEHQKLSSSAVSQILKSASSIGTDHEKSRVLLAVNGSSNFDEKQVSAYLALVDSVGTDYERSRDLMGLMHDHKLGDDSLAKIIAETQKIGTDYEKARVLTEVAQRYNLQGATRAAYIRAANSIGTEYDRNRTLAAITKRELL